MLFKMNVLALVFFGLAAFLSSNQGHAGSFSDTSCSELLAKKSIFRKLGECFGFCDPAIIQRGPAPTGFSIQGNGVWRNQKNIDLAHEVKTMTRLRLDELAPGDFVTLTTQKMNLRLAGEVLAIDQSARRLSIVTNEGEQIVLDRDQLNPKKIWAGHPNLAFENYSPDSTLALQFRVNGTTATLVGSIKGFTRNRDLVFQFPNGEIGILDTASLKTLERRAPTGLIFRNFNGVDSASSYHRFIALQLYSLPTDMIVTLAVGDELRVGMVQGYDPQSKLLTFKSIFGSVEELNLNVQDVKWIVTGAPTQDFRKIGTFPVSSASDISASTNVFIRRQDLISKLLSAIPKDQRIRLSLAHSRGVHYVGSLAGYNPDRGELLWQHLDGTTELLKIRNDEDIIRVDYALPTDHELAQDEKLSKSSRYAWLQTQLRSVSSVDMRLILPVVHEMRLTLKIEDYQRLFSRSEFNASIQASRLDLALDQYFQLLYRDRFRTGIDESIQSLKVASEYFSEKGIMNVPGVYERISKLVLQFDADLKSMTCREERNALREAFSVLLKGWDGLEQAGLRLSAQEYDRRIEEKREAEALRRAQADAEAERLASEEDEVEERDSVSSPFVVGDNRDSSTAKSGYRPKSYYKRQQELKRYKRIAEERKKSGRPPRGRSRL